MLGKELFVLDRPVKADPTFCVSWAFPNCYAVGMSSLAYQLVWWLLEQDLDLSVRRVFTDCHEGPGQACELIGFTLSWELDYVNVLKILSQQGVARLSVDRLAGSPLVFGGGPVLAANPESFADFFDCVLLGDAEVVVPAFIARWKEIRHLTDRREQLIELSSVDGVYVPSLYRFKFASNGPVESVEPVDSRVPPRKEKQIFAAPADYVCHTVMLDRDTTWGDKFLIEVVRSCPRDCNFCLASYISRPFRFAAVDAILNKVDLALKHTRQVGLLGASVTEHPQFDELAGELVKRSGLEISVSSVRADSVTALTLALLRQLGQKSLTIALESGSESLRAAIRKNLSEDQIMAAVELVDQAAFAQLKLYLMVGLPQERMEDLDETIRLLTVIKKLHKRLRIVVGLSTFVPKAQTPFQWSPRERGLAAKLEYLRKHLSRIGVDVRLESHNWGDIQALLSRGDRRLTPALASIAQGAGNLGAWRSAFRDFPPECPSAEYFTFREIPYGETLPWSHLQNDGMSESLCKRAQSSKRLS